MSSTFERFSERLEGRAKQGGQAIYETRLRAKEWTGEGGVKLTQVEKDELGRRACADPTGQMFEDILRNRQKANKLEGTKDIPQDFLAWAKKVKERQEAG